jgi:hypothetical protein
MIAATAMTPEFLAGMLSAGHSEEFAQERWDGVYGPLVSRVNGSTPPEPARDRPSLTNISTMSRPVEAEDWDIQGLARPRAIVVVGSAEGVGKSMMRKEIELRLGSGIGPLFGHFPIAKAMTVATFEEENGQEEEWRRDEQVLAALKIKREDLGDRVHRISYPGLDLIREADHDYIRGQLTAVKAESVWFDTGGSMIGDEWGEPIKVAFRFLRSLEITTYLNVHLVKPQRGGRGAGDHGSKLSDVMGQWTRQADVVCLVTDLGAERVRMVVKKRVPGQTLILRQASGLWEVVAEGGAAAKRPSGDMLILRMIAEGVDDPDDIRAALGTKDKPMAASSFYKALGRLRTDGLIENGQPPYRMTDAGSEAIEA